MNNIVKGFLFFVLSLSSLNCFAYNIKNEIAYTLNEYFTSISNKDFSNAYNFVDTRRTSIHSEDDYINYMESDNSDATNLMYTGLTYRIKAVVVNKGDRSADAIVSLTYPDFSMLSDKIAETIEQTPNLDYDTVVNKVFDYYDSHEMATTTRTNVVHLINRNGEWKIII